MRTLLAAATACLLFFVGLPAGAAAQAPPPPPARPAAPDLALFLRLLAGEFDNFQQIFEQKENKVATPHARLHTVITPVAAPAIGEHVFLAKESPQNAPDTVGNVHLYDVRAAGPAITTRLIAFENPKAVAAALGQAATAAASLPLATARPTEGCDVTWRQDGDAFVGSLKPGACRVPAWPTTGKPATLANTYLLTADGWWFTVKAVDDSGAVVSSQPGDAPYQLRRARLFNCYAALRKDGPDEKFDGMLNVVMHDQGKWIAFRREDGTPTKYAFELSQLRYGQKVPVMKFAVYEEGKEQSIAYSWAETTSKKVGINLRWFQAGCSIR